MPKAVLYEPRLGHEEVNLLDVVNAASAGAASVSSADQTNDSARGVILVMDVTGLAGTTPTVQLILEMKDQASGKYISLGTFTAVSAVSTVTYVVTPGVGAASDGVTAVKGFPLPLTWRVRTVGGGTITDADFKVTAHYIRG